MWLQQANLTLICWLNEHDAYFTRCAGRCVHMCVKKNHSEKWSVGHFNLPNGVINSVLFIPQTCPVPSWSSWLLIAIRAATTDILINPGVKLKEFFFWSMHNYLFLPLGISVWSLVGSVKSSWLLVSTLYVYPRSSSTVCHAAHWDCHRSLALHLPLLHSFIIGQVKRLDSPFLDSKPVL
jgi:hypothetical protein